MEQYFSRFFYSLDLREQCEKNKKITLTRMYILCYFCKKKKKVAIFKMPSSVEISEILSYRKNITWNQLFSNLFSKTVAFTKFLSKKCEKISEISTLCSVPSHHLIFAKISWNQQYLLNNKYSWFDEIFFSVSVNLLFSSVQSY